MLDEDKQSLSEFITVGLSAEEEADIGARPTGRGVLGLLIADPQPLRVTEIGSHPESFGFPPNHPPMASFLGVPIKVRDEVYGNLYLADKVGWSEFTSDDVALVGALSQAAGIAIENARLHDRVRRSAVYEDRDRMARDLHDTVIQRLFALGLTLQGMAARLPDAAASQLGGAVAEIDRVIAQVRSTIYELGMGDESRGIRDDIAGLVRELHAVVGFEVELTFDGPVDAAIADQVLEHLLATLREALTNVGKHAHATRASVQRGGGRDVVLPDHHRRRRRPHRRRGGRRTAASGSRTCAAAPRSSTARSPFDDAPGRRDRAHLEGAARHLTGPDPRTIRINCRRRQHMTPEESPATGRIVVGIDGSPSSLDALSWAARQAHLTGSSLEIVMTWEWPSSYGWAAPIPDDFDPEEDVRHSLESRRRRGARRAIPTSASTPGS